MQEWPTHTHNTWTAKMQSQYSKKEVEESQQKRNGTPRTCAFIAFVNMDSRVEQNNIYPFTQVPILCNSTHSRIRLFVHMLIAKREIANKMWKRR